MQSSEHVVQMERVHQKLVDLISSPLYEERLSHAAQPVLGEGACDADILFIGEAPGKNEAATGRPFCGASGKVLDRLLADIRLDRADVYITNVVKDRPPENRDPTPEEIAAYAPLLDRQIEIIQPKVIATLGRFAMQYVMKRYGLEEKIATISSVHGTTYTADMPYGPVVILPLFHPAVAVYNRNKYELLLTDFAKLTAYV